MTGKDICKRASEWSSYKYWYGGKGEIASVSLADRLRRENPSVWTSSYYNKALKDIDGKTRVGDCSGLVCHAYGIGDISSYGIKDKYTAWSGNPMDGMILWRKGHVGIYEHGKVHELKGIDYDYKFNAYNASEWLSTLYDKNVTYTEHGYDIGWHRSADTGKWWYQYSTDDDGYYKNRVVRINGQYYAFDKDGWMKEGNAIIIMDENGEIIGVE